MGFQPNDEEPPMPDAAATHPCPRCNAPIPGPGGSAGMCPRCLFEVGLGKDPDVEFVITGAGGGPRIPPPSGEELQPFFPTLEILDVIGEGGMGVVYRARQRGLDREVALKVLADRVAEVPGFAERFEQEAKALARLDHPNIVRVHDAGRAGGLFYLVMEYVEGETLRERSARAKSSPEDALHLVRQLSDALQYAHEQGVIHRDVKPENVILDGSGKPKIADFGLAKMAVEEIETPALTMTGQAMGTPLYMAPEQIERPRSVDHRADIYGLGVLLYELWTGELPIGRFELPSDRVDVTRAHDEVVLKALAKDPSKRFASASAFSSALGRLAEGKASWRDGQAPQRVGAWRRPEAAPEPIEPPSVRRILFPFPFAIFATAHVAVFLMAGLLHFLLGSGSLNGGTPPWIEVRLFIAMVFVLLGGLTRLVPWRRHGAFWFGTPIHMLAVGSILVLQVAMFSHRSWNNLHTHFLDLGEAPYYDSTSIVIMRLFFVACALLNLGFLVSRLSIPRLSRFELPTATPRAKRRSSVLMRAVDRAAHVAATSGEESPLVPIVVLTLVAIGLAGTFAIRFGVSFHDPRLAESLTKFLWSMIGITIPIVVLWLGHRAKQVEAAKVAERRESEREA